MKSRKKTNGKVEILIAEDSPTQAERLAHLLEQHGFGVTTATNGREALAMLDRFRPTLIISDVLMPELDGYGLCKAIKANETWKDIPVMLVTTLSDALDVVRGLECGADNFIRKPYDEKYLLSRVDYLLMNVELRRNQKMQMGLEIDLGGQRHFITSERQQILDLLISTYEQAVNINDELKVREKELAHSNQVLSGLYRVAAGLNQAGSEREVAEVALERAMELPGIQAGWIFLREGESGFRLAAARNLPPALEAPGEMVDDCACRSKLISGALDSVTNILECERLHNATGDTRGLLYHASVPLWLGDRTLGVMNLVGPEKGLFNEDELKVLYGVGNQLAVALERARLRDHLEKLVDERTARIIRLNRVYAVLSGINTTIVRIRERRKLFEEACRIAVEQGRFTFAWIGTFDAGTQEITPVARAGRDDGYLSQIHLTGMEDAPGNCELTATAISLGVPVVCNDIASDARMKTWRVEALKRGYRSAALFPLVMDGESIGLFVLYAPDSNVFDEEEMALLVEMAGDISFALDHLRKEEQLEQRTAALTVEIAARNRMEEALRRSEEQYRRIVEGAQEGIWMDDAGNRTTFVNPKVVDILGYTTEEMIGRSIFDFIDPTAISELESRLLRRRSGLGDDYDLLFRRRDGTSVWTRVTASPLRDASGNFAGSLAMITDITERLRSQEEHRRMERQLEKAQRINGLGRVAATIAHEINNMLMGIQPFVEIIGRGAGNDERISNATQQISNSVRRGKRVTEEILRFTNAVAPVRQIINMGEWLTLIEPELQAVVGSGVTMTVDLPPENVFAPCDGAQMQQVITNLVINARDAMPGGGAVTLTLATSTGEENLLSGLSEHERFVRLTVRDAGSGIAPEMLEQIFDPFVTTKRSGTGLGLAVARQVLTQHGGLIFAESAPGSGTAFHILLPRADEALHTVVTVAAQKTSGHIRRLLLVEDEVLVAEGLSSLLELEGIIVRVVDQGREVVGAIDEFAPDVVVLDLTLPDIDGREVFAQITLRWPDLPVVFSSGHGGQADLARELARGHVGFLQKPYEVAALMAAIERAL
ncbi:MAG: response regulator [Thermoanaerobaculia bacterium]|jgi:PAS domain S-box-containing protein